jgi:hypothetical protein
MVSRSVETSTWRDTVLDQLTLGASGLSEYFIVEDPDQLMTEPGIQEELIRRGFEFYPFENSIELRHFYELKIRGNQHYEDDAGRAASLVISIDTDTTSISDLPLDITNLSRKVTLSLSDCFPEIFQVVLKCLEPEELDSLERAVAEYTPGRLGDTASRDFVLRHIYQVAPEVIQAPSDLLRTLLRIHYRDIVIPIILKKRLSELLSKRSKFQNWPLGEIIADSQSFFRFLQNHWRAYVAAVHKSFLKGIKETSPIHNVRSGEPSEVVLPFGHDDVRIYIDNLFLEGFLTPIEIDNSDELSDHWCLIGIKQDHEKEIEKRIAGLISLCIKTLPDENSRHQTWLQFAPRWAELCSLHHTKKGILDDGAFFDLMNLIDGQFKAWMLNKYISLHNHPPIPPVMINHIPRSMAREIDSSSITKSALILIDGLALDQWVTLRNNIKITHVTTEASVFAWVPTVTSVSRQALFSVKTPDQFSKTIYTTSAEPKAWMKYWMEQGLVESEVFYKKNLGRDDVSILIDTLSDHRLRSVGLVINTIDDIMHGMQLGSLGMHNQVKLWAESGYLSQLIDALINYGYTIHLTSDHGNIEASGCGKISEGAIANSRGERARVYPTETLRTEIYKKIEDKSESALLWPQIGLPSDYWPIVMSKREAFVAKNENIVGHGGIAIEEVIVPYIQISRERCE